MKKIYFFFLFIFSFSSHSHEFNPAHLILNEESNFSYSVKLFYPQQYKYNSPEVLYPSNCSTSKVSKSSIFRKDLTHGRSLVKICVCLSSWY